LRQSADNANDSIFLGGDDGDVSDNGNGDVQMSYTTPELTLWSN
jgi:hypothetical protein